MRLTCDCCMKTDLEPEGRTIGGCMDAAAAYVPEAVHALDRCQTKDVLPSGE